VNIGKQRDCYFSKIMDFFVAFPRLSNNDEIICFTKIEGCNKSEEEH
jgi:hypothetical protein